MLAFLRFHIWKNVKAGVKFLNFQSMDDSANDSDSSAEMLENGNGHGSEGEESEESDAKNGHPVQNGHHDDGSEDSESDDENIVTNGKSKPEDINGVDSDDESSENDDPKDEAEDEENDQEEDEEMSSMSEAEDVVKKTSTNKLETNGQVTRKRGRPPKNAASSKSPPKQRGRPKKLQAKDIAKQLDDDGEEDEDGDEDEDEDDDSEESSPKYKKKKRVKEDDENKRRSGRERKVPKKFEIEIKKKSRKKKKKIESDSSGNEEEDSDSDYDTKKKKKVKKKLDKFNIYKKSPSKVTKKQKKVKKKVIDSEDEDDMSEGDEAMFAKNFKKKVKSQDLGEKKSHRLKEKKKYEEEDESHDSDVRSDFDPKEVVIEEDIEGINYVLDHRIGKVGATGERTMFWSAKNEGDPNKILETEDTEEQFLIKWMGWSHLNNTWESEESIKAKRKGVRDVKGIKKLANYQQKLNEFNSWKRRADPEDVEYQEIDIELGRQLLTSYIEVSCRCSNLLLLKLFLGFLH